MNNELYSKTVFWSIQLGKFVNRNTGIAAPVSISPTFSGTQEEWNEMLYEELRSCVNEYIKEAGEPVKYIRVGQFVWDAVGSSILLTHKLKQNDTRVPFQDTALYLDTTLQNNVAIIGEHPKAVLLTCLDM